MEENIHTVEQFYGVYLLYCTNPKYKGRTYIGYTVDPNRRIKQHNKGKKAGGAWRTSNKGPWTMVMIIHGFPNDIAALRFEWAWQHPTRSRRLNHLVKKKAKEKAFDYCLRVLTEMLRVGPWNRLPLTVRWLSQEHSVNFPGDKAPPIHMPICYGPVLSKKINSSKEKSVKSNSNDLACKICFDFIEEKSMSCLNPNCDLISHVNCLAKVFLTVGDYVPIDGKCPQCDGVFLWGDLVRKYKGCYGNLNLILNTEGNDFYSSDSE